MTVSLDDKLKKVGAARRREIEARAASMIAEEIKLRRQKKRGKAPAARNRA
jgi:hypothetical protein